MGEGEKFAKTLDQKFYYNNSWVGNIHAGQYGGRLCHWAIGAGENKFHLFICTVYGVLQCAKGNGTAYGRAYCGPLSAP